MVDILAWLREVAGTWTPTAAGLLVRSPQAEGPYAVPSFDALLAELDERQALVGLPTEPAALANVIEAAMLAYLDRMLELLRDEGHDVQWQGAGDRAYPDLEISGTLFSASGKAEHHAVDIKVARRRLNVRHPPTTTQSRITLYTGNTYFRYPELQVPGCLRPFGDYSNHLDVIVLYDHVPEHHGGVANVEVLVHPAWRIASRHRSSTTREYIGAVTSLEALREGHGEFSTEDEFYTYWRNFPFNTPQTIINILRGR